jgi:phosphatidate cytidylyltransferase
VASSRRPGLEAVADADQASRAHDPDRRTGRSELALRVLSGLVLAPVAIGVAYVGGWPFGLFWGIAAVGVWWEWATLSAGASARMVFVAGAIAIAAATIFAAAGWLAVSAACLVPGTILVGVMAPADRRMWIATGVLYAGAVMIAPVVLRRDPQYGLVAIIFLFAVVWATDIVAYFIGRLIGGPKLAPRLSPKKTWSGALGGAVGAIIAASLVAALAGLRPWSALAAIGFVLSVTSQVGDLFESAFKRWYGAKDAGSLIPGHGGLMDRLDGFIAAAVLAAILGVIRGGTDAPARGLLVW